MSRSGYSDDCDGWALIRWRGAVAAAIRGRRGQSFLRELAEALDAMPAKRLIAEELEADGEFCALGCIGARRGLDLRAINPENREAVALAFGIPPALAAEIMFENDDDFISWEWVEVCGPMRPGEQHRPTIRQEVGNAEELRWHKVRKWVESHLAPVPSAPVDPARFWNPPAA